MPERPNERDQASCGASNIRRYNDCSKRADSAHARALGQATFGEIARRRPGPPGGPRRRLEGMELHNIDGRVVDDRRGPRYGVLTINATDERLRVMGIQV